MINRVVLVGRMTRDPQLRVTYTNKNVTSFTLAVGRVGSDEADYINCVVWNKIAENVEKYCSKGSLVGVEGKLQSRSYDNAQGQKVYVTEVLCSSVQFIDTKREKAKDNDQQTKHSEDVNNDSFNDEINLFDIREEDLQF